MDRFVLFALALCLPSAVAETFNAPALKVNTKIVSIREVERIFSDSMVLIQDKMKRGELTPADFEPAVKTAWTEAIETATQDEIMDQRADKRRKEIINYYLARSGQNLSGEKAMEAFRRLESDYIRRLRRELITAAGGEEELRAALKRRGQTMQEWETGLSRELFRRDVLAIELGPVICSPAMIRAYYEKHPEMFRQEEAWRLRRIRLPKDRFSSPKVALEAANMLKKKALEGADFAELAAKVSDDKQFAEQGGLLTKDGKTDLPSGNFPAEEKIAQDLKDGTISDPIDAGDAFVLVLRIGHRDASVQTFEQAAERAEALAFAERLKLKKREMYEKLKNDSYVEVMQKTPPAHLLKPKAADKGDFVAPDK